jgi:hypothetical protein
MPPAKASAEKEFIVERADVECCESSFDVKKANSAVENISL